MIQQPRRMLHDGVAKEMYLEKNNKIRFAL
jgi:hypothetical protein